ncbi:TPA: hypothetical protein RJG04_003093 [Legionella pneumophila]|nr:hypothetical protein [Legionella pneumophila]MCK1858977.1 hypothetical protein [Legionella pneumophila]HAT2105367.1 hypothetical protein [Legionella pneumophila]HCE5309049.1 hypothetical protein [Legionella pneumophila]HCE5657025.1 hypothetical protein [Legionella pneumophila]HDV5713622.1 hypothetical protein [Legionella pneumophila]
MPAESQNHEGYGVHERACFCLKATKGLCCIAVDSRLHKMPCADQNAFVLRLAGFRPRSTGVRRRTTTTTRGT